MYSPTTAETAAFTAVVDGNRDRATYLMRDMLPVDLKTLIAACHTLIRLAEVESRNRWTCTTCECAVRAEAGSRRLVRVVDGLDVCPQSPDRLHHRASKG